MTRPDQNEDHKSQRPAKNVVIEFSTGPPRFLWEESTPSHVETKTIDTDAHVNAVIDVESSPAPTRIANRYQIIGVLGTGGQATVYLAEDTTLRRKVAIKISKPDWALSVHQQEQFKQEAQSIAALKHPGIVTVHDFGIHDDGRCFIVLEYLPGQSLKDCLKDPEKRKAFTIERTLQLIRQVAEALHYAHHRGIYHRDLKPGNILLDEHGNPHITDFGLAVTEETQRGLKGQVAGTIPYMAPEQVRGEAHWLNGQADIWALGVILYEMLGGRRPFVGASEEEVKEQILCRTAVPLRQLDDQIPEEIERACIRCLTRDLQVRFSTAQEVSHSLVPKASKEMPARSATFERLWSRRILLYAAAVLIILLLAAFFLPVVMRKSKALVVDRWNDVSDVSPEQLAWNSKKEESRWHYDPATKVVEFKTDEFGLLRFGTIQFQDFDLQAQLSQASLRTDESWGLFFWASSQERQRERAPGISRSGPRFE